jgi:hypothetical protein
MIWARRFAKPRFIRPHRDDPDIAWSLRNLGATLDARGQRVEALSYYKRALGIFQAQFPPDHFDGVTLDSWKMADPGRFVVVGDGVMRTEGGMGLLWYSARRYRDFILCLEWKAASSNDNNDNSGYS